MARQKDGSTLREQLESIARNTGRTPKMLAEAQECPDGGNYIWQWFLSLHVARGSGGFGPNPISSVEIAAWARLRRLHLTWWELRAICGMDSAYMSVQAEQSERE